MRAHDPTKSDAGGRDGVLPGPRNLPQAERYVMSLNLLHTLIGLLFFAVWILVGEILVQGRRHESRRGPASNH